MAKYLFFTMEKVDISKKIHFLWDYFLTINLYIMRNNIKDDF